MDTIDPSALTERSPGEAAPAVTSATLSAEFCARYQLEEELGRGSGGQVFRAHDLSTDRRVAVKFLGGSRSPQEIERFLREGRLLARLANPHLVKVYELDQMGEIPYMVTELLEGGTLRQLLTGEPVPPRRAVELICAILDGLAGCHAAGVVHRDLKPENVLFAGSRSARGVPKVADLGVALEEAGAGLTKTGALVGTPRYMAPEQATGEQTGPAADLYAAALMLHEMLTGRHPFPSTNLAEMLAWHVTGEAPRLEGPIGEVIAAGLAKDPAQRPASAIQFRDDLKRALARGRGGPRSGPRGPRAVSSHASGSSAPQLSRAQVGAAILLSGLVAFAAMFAAFKSRRATEVTDPSPGPSASAVVSAREAALANLQRTVEWAEHQADLHHASLNVVRKWVSNAPDPGPGSSAPAVTHAKPTEMGGRLEKALLALEATLPAADRITGPEAHALARGRGLLIAAWTGAVLDIYIARGAAGNNSLATFQTDSPGTKPLWSAADAEYPPSGAEFLRRYFARLAAVSERATAAEALTREDLHHLVDLFRVGRCFSRVRWARSAAREYTGALDRLRATLKSQESRPRGLLARALAASLAMGMDGTTGALVARRFDELSAVLAELKHDQPPHAAWLDGFIASVAENYGAAIESARAAAAGRAR